MPFVAKLRGNYSYSSAEGRNNIRMINGFLNQYGLSLAAQAGIIGNIVAESGLNPWRWERARADPTVDGYGLFQFTPAQPYFDDCSTFLGYGPSRSTSYETAGATPDDGWAQLIAMNTNMWHKWQPACWRSYWDKNQYTQLWDLVTDILSTYGGEDGRLQYWEYYSIADPTDAAIAFMACYEGPSIPNWRGRADNAIGVLPQLSLDTPPEPPGTTPTSNKKWIYYLRPLWWQSDINIRR